MSNTFGNIFRLTTFGESHGPAIGGVIDGVPAGARIDISKIQDALCRRRPGDSPIGSPRNECDEVEILSGLFDGFTTGAPIGFIIRNRDAHSSDYDSLKDIYRPNHADYTYDAKYGIRDHRGGGRASARETACRVVAGAVARQLLVLSGIGICAYTSAIGEISISADNLPYSSNEIYSNPVRCPDTVAAHKMLRLLEEVAAEGDTIGGIATCIVTGAPAGLGNPIYNKLHAMLGNAFLSINAVKGVDFGMGFEGCRKRGSETMDVFTIDPSGSFSTYTNHSGGIQGGISNGNNIISHIAFKPIATMMRDIPAIDRNGTPTTLNPGGRHDVCAIPRAIPVVEAMAAMVLMDVVLMNRCTKI